MIICLLYYKRKIKLKGLIISFKFREINNVIKTIEKIIKFFMTLLVLTHLIN